MASRELPGKEAGLFRQVVKFYESKQYKKGLKAADQVLKKFPDHGETLAMKGLILNCQERKEEAYEFVRRGLKHDLKSHVCWHVYGLLHRSDRNYDEAIKCYKNALRIDKENQQILRDLANLQVQIRDIPGFVETRQQLLAQKPAAKVNWISYAVAQHLASNFELAFEALSAYQNTLEEVPASEAYEHSEMLLYKAMLLDEGGKLQEALDNLEASKEQVKDQLGLLEHRASLLLRLERHQDAEAAYRHLLSLGSDNYDYHRGLQASLKLLPGGDGKWSVEQLRALDSLYTELQRTYPRSNAARRIPLDYKEGASFESAADAYVRPFLQKGIPSLFSDLKPLYRDAAKAEILGRVLERIHEALLRDGSLPSLAAASGESSAQGSPAFWAGEARLWTQAYLAQHYDKLGRIEEALSFMEACIEEQPALLDLYSVKSRLLKHAGDLEGASAAADKARSMDLADRYLNGAAVKWLFRAGKIEQAEKTATLFTKDGEQTNNLFDMQCMWYEVECGLAYLRQQQYGKALKMFSWVSKHFTDFTEDQFDFHSYCIRKMTLRSYMHMLRMEDGLYNHIYFSKAAWGAIRTYLKLHDRPQSATQSAEEEESKLAAMSAEERKKYKQKKRKEEQKRKKEEEAEAAAAREAEAKAAKEREKEKAGNKKAGGAAKEKDPDPDGAALAKTEDPLGKATQLLQKLKEHSGERLQTHLLAFEVHLRKGKLLLALQAAKRAQELAGSTHPDVHRLVVRWCRAVEAMPAPDSQVSTVREVIDAQAKALLGGQTLAQVSEGFRTDHAGRSLRHRAAAAEMLALLQQQQKAAAVALLVDGGAGGASHADCVEVHELLRDTIQDTKGAEAWWKACQAVFSWSAYFQGAKRLPLEQADKKPAANHLAANGVDKSLEKLSLQDAQKA